MQAELVEKDKAGNQHSKGSVKNSKLLNTRPHKESSSTMKKVTIPGDTKNSQGSVSRTSSRETSVNHRTSKKEIPNNSVVKQSGVVKDKKLPESLIKNKISSSSNALVRKHPPKTKESSDSKVIATKERTAPISSRSSLDKHDNVPMKRSTDSAAKASGSDSKVIATKERTAPISSRSSLDKHDNVPMKRSTDSAAKASGVVSRRTSDKKDQNLKFKGGGSSNDYSDKQPAKTNLISKSLMKPSLGESEKKRKEEGKIRVGTSGVNSVDKRMGQIQKLNEKKSNSVGVNSTRNSIKDSSASRIKENFKKVLSEQVKKSSHQPSKDKSESSSSSVNSKERKVSGKINSDKIGRERTRTWTITSNAEDVENGSESRDPQPDVSHRGGGDGPSVQKKKSNVSECIGDVLKGKHEEVLTASGDGPHIKNSAKIMDSVEKNVIEKNDLENNDGVEDYNYEDDFEDYESDFEECTDESDESDEGSSDGGEKSNDTNDESTDEDEDGTLPQETEVEKDAEKNASMEGSSTLKDEEEDVERKLDSGLYDSGRRKRQEEEHIPKKLPRVDADEGFEERQEEERSTHDELESVHREAPVLSSPHCISCEVYSLNRGTQKKEVLMKAYDRGNEVLRKITLDEISYSLLDLPPIPYESFMKCRGHLNTKQISTQTNEDSHSESVQTDTIGTKDAWTQKPPVMGQAVSQMDGLPPQLLDNSSWTRLGRFVEAAGEVMAILLEEQWSNGESMRQNPTLLSSSFSKFSMKLGQDGSSSVSWESLLSSRPVLSVCFCRTRSNLLLCSHGPAANFSGSKELHSFEKGDLDSELSLGFLTVWSISEPSSPYKILSCQSCISRSCFQEGSRELGQVVFAGADDGSISVWDLYEKGNCCKKLSLIGSHEEKALCPTFTTYRNETHLGRIVGLEPIFESDFGDEDAENNFSQKLKSANQICSLDQWGLIIVWSVIRRGGVSAGKVSLVASMKLCLSENGCNTTVNPFRVDSNMSEEISLDDESCNGIALWNSLAVNFDWILAASDTGNVVCLPIDGEQRSIRVYSASKDSVASAECIAVNPQGLPFFMVGNYAGQVHMYSHSSTRTFGCWETPSSSLPSPIMKLAWSPQRPFVFFTVDAVSRMHIWDLARSDIFPIATIQPPKEGKITDISLSFSKGKSAAYMALGMDNGQVILHQLNEELTNKNQEISKKEVLQFIKYTNLL